MLLEAVPKHDPNGAKGRDGKPKPLLPQPAGGKYNCKYFLKCNTLAQEYLCGRFLELRCCELRSPRGTRRDAQGRWVRRATLEVLR